MDVVIVDELIVEMIVIVAMPNIVTTVPCSRPIIPRNVTAAALPTPTREMAAVRISANMSAGDMTSSKVAAAEMSAAHASTKVSGTHAAEMSAAHTSTKVTAAAATTTTMADEPDVTGVRADPILQVRSAGICLSRYDRGKQQAARKGCHCSCSGSHDASPF